MSKHKGRVIVSRRRGSIKGREKGDVRKAIFKYLGEKGIREWTIHDLVGHREIPFAQRTISSSLSHSKKRGLIVKKGMTEEWPKVAIWSWPHKPQRVKEEFTLPPQPPALSVVEQGEASFHMIGKQVIAILRKQDERIAENNEVIGQLIQERDDLREKLNSLKLKLNALTNGRVTSKELSDMRKRAGSL